MLSCQYICNGSIAWHHLVLKYMYMAYSKNPHLPRVRMRAVVLVRQGWGIRKTARYLGYHHTAVMKWCKKADQLRIPNARYVVPTKSSRPHSHPNSLKPEIVDAIIKQRKKNNRCAEVVHQELLNKGVSVSLSSVKRTLDRNGFLKKRSIYKRWHRTTERPLALKPGDLVQVDTIHLGPCNANRLYVYTLLDVFSRWAWAGVSLKINTYKSLQFVKLAQNNAVFRFNMLQSDHGQEFSTYFTEHIQIRGHKHRHIRIRKPIDLNLINMLSFF